MFYIYKIFDDGLDLDMGDLLQYYLVTDNDDMDDVFFSLKQEYNHITQQIYERTARIELIETSDRNTMTEILASWRILIDNNECLNHQEMFQERKNLLENRNGKKCVRCKCSEHKYISSGDLLGHIKQNIHQKYLINNRNI